MLLSLYIWLEALASGILSVIIYSFVRIINIELGIDISYTPFYRWLFFTGYYKHSLSYFLGLNDYLNTKWAQHFSKNFVDLFYSSIGSKLASSYWGHWFIGIYDWFKKLDNLTVVLLESFLEAISFLLMGMAWYLVGLRGILNIFVTAISLYMLFEFCGLHFTMNRLL